MRSLLPILFPALFALGLQAKDSQPDWKFDFGAENSPSGWQSVSPEHVWSGDHGYGVERGARVTISQKQSNRQPQDDALVSDYPWFFSVAVPEGTYRVTLTLGDPNAASDTTVKAECRQLMLEEIQTAPGETVTKTFLVDVRTPDLPPPPKNAPGGSAVRINEREEGIRRWDHFLSLEFNGSHPSVAAMEITPVNDAPTVFIAGDSTVTDQPGEDWSSWAQMLPRFFDGTVAVSNHSESGETLKSFLTGLRLDKILSRIKPGDYLFIQFGHNDSKTSWPQTYAEPFTTYAAYLRAYIAEARRRGAYPVLVTSMHRRSFDENGKVIDTHGDYPVAMKAVAAELDVPLIDLHAMSRPLYEAWGPPKAPQAFANHGKDGTHHNNYGGYELARCVVEGLRTAVPELAKHLASDAGHFDPSHPDPVDTFDIPPSPEMFTGEIRGN